MIGLKVDVRRCEIIKKVIKFLKYIVNKYELKYPQYEEPIYICDNWDTRNRYKNEKYKIPKEQPQCPVYNDNRCCGGCKLAAECDYCVNCGCYGFTYGQMGGNAKNYYLHKASEYYGLGRIGKDGKFDWDYYYIQKKKKDIQIGKFIIWNENIYEIKSKPNRNGKFKVVDCVNSCWTRLNIHEMERYVRVYDSRFLAEYWLKMSQ